MALVMALHEVHSGNLSFYKAACEEHPEVKSFDSSLQERTNKVVNFITAQVETGSYSVHASYAEVYGYLLEAIQDVAKFITDSKDDVWKNEDLRSLVNAYFEDTDKTLDFFNTVNNLVYKASTGNLHIQRAVEFFDKESENNKKYEKTLEELKMFQDMKHDFDCDKLKTQFALVKMEQESLLDKVSKLKKKLDEENEQAQAHSRTANIVFGAVFACVAIIGVATFAFGGEALVAGAVAAGLSLPFIALGWAGTHAYLDKLEDTLKKQDEIAKEVDKGLEVNKDAMVTIIILVENLINKISSLLEIADIPTEDDEIATKLSLQVMKKKMGRFTDAINEVGENVATLRKLVIVARDKVWEKILGFVPNFGLGPEHMPNTHNKNDAIFGGVPIRVGPVQMPNTHNKNDDIFGGVPIRVGPVQMSDTHNKNDDIFGGVPTGLGPVQMPNTHNKNDDIFGGVPMGPGPVHIPNTQQQK